MRVITTAEDCMRKDMLAYVSYPPRGQGACFPYLRYVIDGDEVCQIDSQAFPETGAMVVPFYDNLSADEVRDSYGDIVVVRLNGDEPSVNDERADQMSAYQNYYRAFLHRPNRVYGEPEITFTRFSKHPLSTRLFQILTLESVPPFDRPLSSPVRLGWGQEQPVTQLVMVETSSSRGGKVLVGPFQATARPDGTVSLESDDDYGYRVKEYREDASSVMVLRDEDQTTVARFIDSRVLLSGRTPVDRVYDWLPNEELVQTLANAITSSSELRDLGKAAQRRLRKELRNSLDRSDDLNLDDGRKERLLQVFDDATFFANLPEDVKDLVATSIPEQKLAKIVKSDPDSFSAMIRSLPEVSEAVERERAKLSHELDGLKAETTKARADRDEAVKDKEEAVKEKQRAEDDAKAAREQALAGIRADVEALQTERDSLKGEVADLEAQKGELDRGIGSVLEEMRDGTELSRAIVTQGIVRRAVDFASSLDRGESEVAPAEAPAVYIRKAEEDMSDGEVIDGVFNAIAEESGRDYSRNDVINLLICLTQGYVTTLAGLPGTGKTSLAEILASALGLYATDKSSRFVEVSVERGWASHKDLVGYYNPLTKTVEKSNPEVYDSMTALARETSEEGPHAPFLYLLDEANLSPIEHYWAPFLRACDTFGRTGTALPLGGEQSLRLPPWVRFIAMVNNDFTTEELSPRFLDRSWVVTLESETLDADSLGQEYKLREDIQPFSQERLSRTFGRNTRAALSSTLRDALGKVTDVCSSYGKPVSARSQAMIASYLSAATNLMDTGSAEARFAPVDYAVAQKVLPLLSGGDDQMYDLLRELDSACVQLPQSRAIVERMIARGEGNGYYQFFE